MRDKADAHALPRRGARLAEIVPYVLIAGAVVLGWQIVIQPLAQRGPVAAAIRVAPASPLVLRRAAEAELAAGRTDAAASLARDALHRSPFDIRALRVIGLTEARAGREAEADNILTLAGNWSLRDDPAHAWLVEHRLRAGDYASAFAHADTLVRRREDLQPRVFSLFTVAGSQDPERSLPVIASLLAKSPPWRRAYLRSLNTTSEGLQVSASLAVLLQSGSAPYTNTELGQLYLRLLRAGQVDALKAIRTRLNRPAATAGSVVDGEFDAVDQPQPFRWDLAQKPGVFAEFVGDDLKAGNSALRVDYNGYATARIAAQLLFLPAGPHRLTYQSRTESGDASTRFNWKISCTSSDRRLLSSPAGVPQTGEWRRISASFEVPTDCPAQWLVLEARPADRRAPIAAWFDNVEISPIA